MSSKQHVLTRERRLLLAWWSFLKVTTISARCIVVIDSSRLPYSVSQHDAPVKCLRRCHSKQELWTHSQKTGRQDEGHGWYSGQIRRATRPICCHPLSPDFAIERKRAPWPCPPRENGMKQSSTKPSREIQVASNKRGNKAKPVAIWSLQAKHDGSVLSMFFAVIFFPSPCSPFTTSSLKPCISWHFTPLALALVADH